MLTGCGAHVYHQVRKGDTLYSISWHYKQDYRQVAEWNGLAPPYTIKQGQWLRVAPPGPDAGLAPPVYTQRQSETTASESGKKSVEKQQQVSKPAVKSVPQTTDASIPTTAPQAWIWPLKGKVIRKFAADTPGKQGIDISAAAGTLVHAAAPGKVVYSGNGLRGYGNLIIIKHSDKFLSAYAHNRSILVKEGATVKQGDAIARVGSTQSSQVKLHFQIRINGQPVDPLRYLPK